MLKLLVVCVLSFASMGAAANVPKPLASEVLANAGTLSVVRLSAEQMQETDGAMVPLVAIGLWGLGKTWAFGKGLAWGFAMGYAFQYGSPYTTAAIKWTYNATKNTAKSTYDKTAKAFEKHPPSAVNYAPMLYPSHFRGSGQPNMGGIRSSMSNSWGSSGYGGGSSRRGYAYSQDCRDIGGC